MLLEAIKALDDRAGEDDDAVAFDLGRLLTGREAAELTDVRAELEELATAGHKPVTRQLGYLALIAADGGVDRAWTLASQVGRLAPRPGRRDARDPRSRPACGALSQGLAAARRAAEVARRRRQGVEGDRGPIRPDRAARAAGR